MGTNTQDAQGRAGAAQQRPRPSRGRSLSCSLWEGPHTRKDMLGPALGQTSDRADMGSPSLCLEPGGDQSCHGLAPKAHFRHVAQDKAWSLCITGRWRFLVHSRRGDALSGHTGPDLGGSRRLWLRLCRKIVLATCLALNLPLCMWSGCGQGWGRSPWRVPWTLRGCPGLKVTGLRPGS